MVSEPHTKAGRSLAFALHAQANLVQSYSDDPDNPNVSAWLRSGAIQEIVKVEAEAGASPGVAGGIENVRIAFNRFLDSGTDADLLRMRRELDALVVRRDLAADLSDSEVRPDRGSASEVDLDELERLLAEARPGPWEWLDSEGTAAEDDSDELQDGYGETVATGFSDDIVLDGKRLTTDGRLCAALRNAAPALIAAARLAAPADERLRRERLFVIESVRQFVEGDPLGGGRERTLKFLDGIAFSEGHPR